MEVSLWGVPLGAPFRICAMRGFGQGWALQELSNDSLLPLTSSLGFLGPVGATRRRGRVAVAVVGRSPAVPTALGTPDVCLPCAHLPLFLERAALGHGLQVLLQRPLTAFLPWAAWVLRWQKQGQSWAF